MSADLIYRLRQLSEAYPVEVWPALTDAERDSIAGLLDRASAGMGRHFSGVFKEAADALEARAQPVAAIPEAGQSVPKLEAEQIFGIAEPYFLWNADDWRKATEGAILMPTILTFARAIERKVIASMSADAGKEVS